MIANSNTPRDYRNQTGARLVNYCLDDIFSLNPKVVTAQMRASITLGDLIVTNQTLQCAGAFGRRSQKSGICHVRLRSAGASTCVSHTWKAMADSGYRRVMRDGHTYQDRLKEILDLAFQLQAYFGINTQTRHAPDESSIQATNHGSAPPGTLRRLRQIYGHLAAARLTYFGIVEDLPIGYRDLQVMELESL